MNFLMRLSTGLEIQTQGSEQRGRKARDWRSSSPIIEPCLFWMAWSRYKIRLVHKKDGYASLASRRFCASLLPSIRGFVSLPQGCRSLILLITKAPQPCAATLINYPAMLVPSCSERWALGGMRASCELRARSSLAIVSH